MTLNVGYIESTGSGGVSARVYYDTAFVPVGDAQPLINGPEGFCLVVRNPSGARRRVTVRLPNGTEQTFTLQQGDPVTSQSRTRQQMAQWGFTVRGDLAGGFELLNVT